MKTSRHKKRRLTARQLEALRKQQQSGGTPAVLTRLCAGATVCRTARAVGVTTAHLSRVFSGKRKPSLELASKMASYLGVGLGELYAALIEVQDGHRTHG